MKRIFRSLVIITAIFSLNTQASLLKGASPEHDNLSTLRNHYPHNNLEIAKLLERYRTLGALDTYLVDDTREKYADNMLSWQLESGGFGIQNEKAYLHPWNGKQKRSQWVSNGIEHGNFDDNATVAEIRFLAAVYQQSTNLVLRRAIKSALTKGIQFIFDAQHVSGGWPQVYPKRTNNKGQYSNHVTLNDDAMIRVMVLLSDISAQLPPFNGGIIEADIHYQIYPRLLSAVDFLLKAQIKSQGELTIWAGQHNTRTYQPEPGRKYEPVAKAAQESAGVLVYLLNWPAQTPAIERAIEGGITWYKNNLVSDLWQNKKTGKFETKQGKRLWYRFYEIEGDTPFFCGRDGVKKTKLSDIEWERRTGYGWGGDYAGHLLKAVRNNTKI